LRKDGGTLWLAAEIDLKEKILKIKFHSLNLVRVGAFICKALKGEAIVYYASFLITQQMEASVSPSG
jgi:hypothetical protein